MKRLHFDQRYCTASKLSIQNLTWLQSLQVEHVDMVAITAGRTSFADFENDVKILFSKWPIETDQLQILKSWTEKLQSNRSSKFQSMTVGMLIIQFECLIHFTIHPSSS